jgi:hypothetical protein
MFFTLNEKYLTVMTTRVRINALKNCQINKNEWIIQHTSYLYHKYSKVNILPKGHCPSFI